jgi:putative alpha-1,2-mannosidase
VFAPRNPDGSWARFDPNKPERPDIWNDPYYYEGTGAEWTLTAFHVMHELVARHGGGPGFAAYLDQFLDKDLRHWKELILHAPYLYHYAGMPHRSAERVREKIRTKYMPTRSGLPDNEDMGAQSAFWICSAIGLYPIMGQTFYLLTTPFFEEIELELGASGSSLRISAAGAEGAAGATRYIANARLNGVALDRAWVRHDEIVAGGRLELTLSDEPGAWGAQVPPRE